MIVWLFRFLLFLVFIVLVYSGLKFLKDPMRKLKSAERKKQFFFHDDPKDALRNFYIVYNGVRFEGEKYVGATEDEFTVTSILVRIVEPNELFGLNREDFYQIEREIYKIYPNAEITWQSPIANFLSHHH